jgi:hypothetical protein
MRASNCTTNLFGVDRDVAVRRDAAIANASEPVRLPSAADLDAYAEEESIRLRTGVNNTENDNGI